MTTIYEYERGSNGNMELANKIFSKIYTINGAGNQPRIGVLIFFDENGNLLSRFTTLRSPKDNNNKQLMRTVLENRAKNAKELLDRKGFSNDYFYSENAYFDILESEHRDKVCSGIMAEEWFSSGTLKKIYFDPVPSDYETYLIKSSLEKFEKSAKEAVK